MILIWMKRNINFIEKGLKMKKLCLFLIGLLSYAQIASADINKNEAVKLIETVTEEGIEQIINSNSSQEEKNKVFRKLFTENLDLDYIGKFVLGRYWRTITPAQRKEFIDLYKEFNFDGTSPANNPNQIFVNTSVPMQEGAPASVKWRVNDVNGKLKIIDIIVENVSLAQTARNEYTSFIAKSPKGMDGLLENLRAKINK